MTTMRPSPQPRSYRISPLLTSPSFNKASTTSGGVGTYGTSPRGASGAWAASGAAARIRLHSTCARQKPLRGAENGNVRLILMVASVPPSRAAEAAEFRRRRVQKDQSGDWRLLLNNRAVQAADVAPAAVQVIASRAKGMLGGQRFVH